jgi:hypothetical protein
MRHCVRNSGSQFLGPDVGPQYGNASRCPQVCIPIVYIDPHGHLPEIRIGQRAVAQSQARVVAEPE